MVKPEGGHDVWFHRLDDCETVLFPVVNVTTISFELKAQCYGDTGGVFKVLNIRVSS